MTSKGIRLRDLQLERQQKAGGFQLRIEQLELPSGSFTVILGPNGAGKTTLARCLGGLEPQAKGEIQIAGHQVAKLAARERGRILAFVAQDERRRVPHRVRDLVLMGRYPHQGSWPFDSDEDMKRVDLAMASVGVDQFADRYLNELSGGERQRVFLARALAQEPQFLILDEPASNLDIGHQLELYELLAQLNRDQGLTILAVSHEFNMACRHASHIVLLREGQLVESGDKASVLTAKNLGALYAIRVASYQSPTTAQTNFFPEGSD